MDENEQAEIIAQCLQIYRKVMITLLKEAGGEMIVTIDDSHDEVIFRLEPDEEQGIVNVRFKLAPETTMQ